MRLPQPGNSGSMATVVVEGDVDEAVIRRLCAIYSIEIVNRYGGNGKDAIRKSIQGYDRAARLGCWIVLVDLDHEQECAPTLAREWLPRPAPKMCFRIAVREVEAWLMADSEHLAQFLGIPKAKIPQKVDEVEYPKRLLVQLAAKSRRRDIREDMVPRSGSKRRVGPAYVSRLVEFVSFAEANWRAETARAASPSLDRCLHDLERRF